MSPTVKPVPEGYTTITPSLTVRDCAAAMAFYQKAFGAEEKMRMTLPGGKVVHAEMRIGTAVIMLADEIPGMANRSPQAIGGSPVAFYLYVQDVDAAWKRALGAGAQATFPVDTMFWGDRMGVVLDPYGLSWTLAQHVRDVGPEEMARGQAEFLARMEGKR